MTLPLPIPGPTVVGIDLSMNSTGIARIKDGLGECTTIKSGTKKGYHRLEFMSTEVVRHAQGADLVLIEEIPWGAKSANSLQMAGNWYVCTHALWKAGIYFVVVNLTYLKKYATGRGSGIRKEEVGYAAIKRYPGVDIRDNDQADALILAAMGTDWLGHPIAPVPQANRAVLASIRGWPARLSV
jgi:Holliday junction resolvasome RuvABC endonuclease subunit